MSDHFFTVKHALPINVIPLAMDYPVPDLLTLENELPEVFRIANAVAEMDSHAHQRMGAISNDDAKALISAINLQAQKIEIILNYILSQTDEPRFRAKTTSFSGNQIVYNSKKLLKMNQPVRLKIFLPEEYAAIYCYGLIKKRAKAKNGFQLLVKFASIREMDQELIVRASLHVQSKLLRKRAEQKRTEQ